MIPRSVVIIELDSPPESTLATGGAQPKPEAYARVDGAGTLLLYTDAAPSRSAGIATPVEMLFAAGTCGPQAGSHLFRVGLQVPREYRDEFLAWYETEHLPMLLGCAQWKGCRFVEAKRDAGCQFYALHQLASPAALDSPERKASRATPWFRRFAQQAWFDAPFTRVLYRRID